jgi:hypothetical protein
MLKIKSVPISLALVIIVLITGTYVLIKKEPFWRFIYPNYLVIRTQLYKNLGIHSRYDISDVQSFFSFKRSIQEDMLWSMFSA